MSLDIHPLSTPEEAHACAALMASSEPWASLGRSYAESRRLVDDPQREVYAASDDGAFCGFIILIMQGAFVGYIQIIAVAPEARSRGVGTQLIAFAERRIFSEYPNAFLCVSSTNPRARALYERLGYEPVGEMRDYLVTGVSELLMRKSIAPIREFRR